MVRNQQASQDTESHFYVHPSEGPHSLLISPKFNSSNYLAWSRSMQRALGAKKNLPFINGSLPVPVQMMMILTKLHGRRAIILCNLGL